MINNIEMEAFLKPYFENLEVLTLKGYPTSTFYTKDNKIIFEYESNMGYLWVNRELWFDFAEKFNLQKSENHIEHSDYHKISNFIKPIAEKHLNIISVRPLLPGNGNFRMVEKFNLAN